MYLNTLPIITRMELRNNSDTFGDEELSWVTTEFPSTFFSIVNTMVLIISIFRDTQMYLDIFCSTDTYLGN